MFLHEYRLICEISTVRTLALTIMPLLFSILIVTFKLIFFFRTFLVCVDKVTHKPTPLPEWWLKQFKPKIPVNSKPHVVQPFEKLSDVPVYCYQMKAHYCDVDLFGHVNNANYLKYCLEAASDAVKNKFYSKVLKNVYRCHMQDMEQLYIGQCHAGDTIAMETWENPSDPYTLYFMMFNNGTCIYQCTLKLYP